MLFRSWGHAQRRGLLRTDVDATVLASWWFSHLDSRIHLELAPTRIDGAAWNLLAREAAIAAVFGAVAD